MTSGGPSPQRVTRDNRTRILYVDALVRHAPTQVERPPHVKER